MVNIEETIKNLKARGFDAKHFASGKAASNYLAETLTGKAIGFGGSKTLESLGLYERLSENNRVFWHWKQDREEAHKSSAAADVYITSANAIAQTGEIINIDGTGNRVSSTLFGKKELYFVVGINKLAADYDSALWRARNVAAPLNARRFNKNTPCVNGELRCYNCSSPDRICRGLVVLWEKMFGTDKVEVIIVDEDLGY